SKAKASRADRPRGSITVHADPEPEFEPVGASMAEWPGCATPCASKWPPGFSLQRRIHLAQELVEIERLGQVASCPRRAQARDLARRGVGADHQDGDVAGT